MLDQPSAACLDKIEAPIEPVVVAVVRIGDVLVTSGMRIEGSEQDQPRFVAMITRLMAGFAGQSLAVTAVHADHQIGLLEPMGLKGLRHVAAVQVAAALQCRLSAWVHRLTSVPIAGAGTSHVKVLCQ